MDVLHKYEIRKTKKQKSAFITAVTAYAQSQRYSVKLETGSRGVRNIVIGDPSRAKYLVTAHYDTPASIGLPNFITPNNPVSFILIQCLILIPFFVVAFLAGWLVSLATDNEALIFWAAYIAYFGMLFLMLFGPANRHNANDNTSGVITVLETMASMPENQRHRVCFVLFDQEEKGLVGSSVYRKAHKKEVENQIVLNLDCVGDGDVIQLAPVKKAKKDDAILQQLSAVCGKVGKKELRLRSKGFTAGNSDHKNFPNGVGIMAFKKSKLVGLYCDRIHTWRDVHLDQTNVNILRAAIISLICQ